MSDSSLTIYGRKVSPWIEPERVGVTIAVTFTASKGSPLSARITSLSHSLDGSENSSLSVETLGMISGLLYTRSEELRQRQSSTPRSHSGCWCDSSRKPDTSDVLRAE